LQCGLPPGSKFELYLSSPKFDGMKLLERHRTVQGLLTTAGLMARIHAVTIKAWTPAEWVKNEAQVPKQ
jgi:acid stress-induced BolA-like protein IbaG/YrbA